MPRNLTVGRTIIHLLLSAIIFQSQAQVADMQSAYKSDPTILNIPTPHAASLGSFGRVPVDLYNGLYSLSIPIYTLPVKGHPMDVKLSYHGGGLKPSDKGGTVGVSWALIGSGSITRIVNGTADEHIWRYNPDTLIGYYWNRSELNRADWDDTNTMKTFIKKIYCQGSPGDSYCPATPLPQWHDWAPDEFLFNCYGYSGSFWMDNNGNWVVSEANGEKLTVTVDFGAYSFKYPTALQALTNTHTFKKFTLTDGNGNSFVFGGDQNAVEFNRTTDGNDSSAALPTSWMLSQCKTNRGETVNYGYQRLNTSVSVSQSFYAYKAVLPPNSYSTYDLANITGILHDPVYLSYIAYNKDSVKFSYSPSNIYSYSQSPLLDPATGSLPYEINQMYQNHVSTLPSQELAANYPADYKLDSIIVKYDSSVNRFTFNYYDSVSANRLFLKSFSMGPTNRALTWQFDYNGTKFSDYADGSIYDGLLTTKIDHWGYYTGIFPYKTSELRQSPPTYMRSDTSFPNDNFVAYYIAARRPKLDSMKVGSLSRITYPTGGYSNFIYEAHDYGTQLNVTNNQPLALGADSIAGGLRIKEVDSYADANSIPFIKKYVYKNENGRSSGVLNSAGILYKDSVLGASGFVYKFFGDNNVLPLQNTSGNHVTYTRIEEVDSDSGRTVYRYTNHDNNHYDLFPRYFMSSTAGASYFRKNNSRNFQRGKLITQTAYDSSRALVSRDSTLYINDDSLTSNRIGVRAYGYVPKDVKMLSFIKNGQTGPLGPISGIYKQANIYIPAISPYVFYAHYYPQIQKTATYYKGTDSIQTVQTWKYDSSNNKVALDSLKNLSDASTKITTYTYPSGLKASNAFYTGMVSNNVIDPVIRQTETNQSGKLINAFKDSLVKNTVGGRDLYRLYEKDQYIVSSDVQQMNIFSYDSVGNMIDVVGTDGVPVTYLWDYGAMHPVAVTKNAATASVAYTSFEAEGTGNWTFTDTTRNRSQAITGKKSYPITNAKTITGTVPSGVQYIVSYWAQSAPAVVKANGASISVGVTGLTKGGWTYYESTLPNTTTTVTITGASASSTLIDELRLYPFNAQMTTYTYSPLAGITSACSPANDISYFTWDEGLNQLLRIRDIDKNIVKQFEYKYKQLIVPVSNTFQTRNFTRDCGPGYSGSLYTYSVPAGKYRSYVSVEDANAMANAEIDANGQHNADSVGICYVNLYCTNSAGASGFTANYTSTTNPTLVWHFPLPSSGNHVAIGSIPSGRYSLTITNASNGTTYTFGSGCGATTVDGTSGSFSLVPVGGTTCNTLTISYPF